MVRRGLAVVTILFPLGCGLARNDDDPERRSSDAGEGRPTTDCEVLGSAVDAAYARLSEATKRYVAPSGEAEDGDSLAATYDAVSRDMASVGVADPRVAALRDRYRDLFLKAGADLREIMAHGRAKDVDRIQKKRAEVQAEKAEAQLRADMNATCPR
jgi:hypothetical protein